MAKNKLSLPLALMSGCLALGTTGVALADDVPNGFYINPQVGYYFFDSKRPGNSSFGIEDEVFYGLGAGWQFDSPFAVELNYLTLGTELEGGSPNFDYEQYRLDGLYHFYSGENYLAGGWLPYVAFGAGQAYFKGQSGADADETQVNLGGGLKYLFSNNVSLRTDARAFYGIDDDTVDYAVTLGLQIMFGNQDVGKKPVVAAAAVVPAVVDSDGDGVNDPLDRCPNTPAGTPVDANGCMLDADGDGVADNADACPDSSAGAKVDARGCYVMLTERREVEINIPFELNSAVISPNSSQDLSKVAQFMREYPQVSLTVEGHTDSSGAEDYNMKLSQQRAQAVADSLVNDYSVPRSRVTAVGKGEANPIADNSTEAGREENRRVMGVAEAQVQTQAP